LKHIIVHLFDHSRNIFFFQAEDGIRDRNVTGVQTCALPILYTIIPEVTLTQSCLCRVQILSLREGSSGQSQTKQEKTLSLPANQPIALTKLSLNISPEDRVKIVVTVSDGQSLHLSQQWPPSSEKS